MRTLSNEVLDQDQIEQMLVEAGQVSEGPDLLTDDYLTKNEQDLLGEIGNICMGTSATTMSTLLGRKVGITTPMISIHTLDSLSREYPVPLVVSEVQYTEGLEGNNLLILKEYDVALITNLMLGDEEEVDPDHIELTEIHMSAMGEIMNQMVGSSATALADILHKLVNISTPTTRRLVMDSGVVSDSFADPESPLVKISFKMEIEDLLTSEIMQIIPVEFAKSTADSVWRQMQEDTGMTEEPLTSAPAAQAPATPAQQAQPQSNPQPAAEYVQPQGDMQPAYNAPENNVIRERQNIRVSEPQFPSFNNISGNPQIPSLDNIEMIMDVPMNVTVELGKTHKKIRDILDFNIGSVIVLDRIAGDMVDILVNGKCIGKGEVVVIDDNYGIRITEINMPNANDLI